MTNPDSGHEIGVAFGYIQIPLPVPVPTHVSLLKNFDEDTTYLSVPHQLSFDGFEAVHHRRYLALGSPENGGRTVDLSVAVMIFACLTFAIIQRAVTLFSPFHMTKPYFLGHIVSHGE